MTRRLFVTVGTDHHPFDRLVEWVDRWAPRAEGWQIAVQHGRTRAPQGAPGFDFCDHDELQRLLDEADVVVCHGGPATITQARRRGHHPIVVPRDPARGEHVDDHQLLFARRLATAGLVELAESEDTFLAALVTIAYLPRPRTALDDDVPAAVHRIGQIAQELVTRSRDR